MVQKAQQQNNALVIVRELGGVTAGEIAVYQRSITHKNTYDSSADQISVLRKDTITEQELHETLVALIDYCDKQINVTRGLSDEQVLQIVDDIKADCWYLRLNEIIYALKSGTSGKFGGDYGKIDKLTISTWIGKYEDQYRTSFIEADNYRKQVGNEANKDIQLGADAVLKAYLEEQGHLKKYGITKYAKQQKEAEVERKRIRKKELAMQHFEYTNVQTKQQRQNEYDTACAWLIANGFVYSEDTDERKSPVDYEARFYREDFPMIRVDVTFRYMVGYNDEDTKYSWSELKELMKKELTNLND